MTSLGCVQSRWRDGVTRYLRSSDPQAARAIADPHPTPWPPSLRARLQAQCCARRVQGAAAPQRLSDEAAQRRQIDALRCKRLSAPQRHLGLLRVRACFEKASQPCPESQYTVWAAALLIRATDANQPRPRSLPGSGLQMTMRKSLTRV